MRDNLYRLGRPHFIVALATAILLTFANIALSHAGDPEDVIGGMNVVKRRTHLSPSISPKIYRRSRMKAGAISTRISAS